MTTPYWMQDAIFYQIFPDRFAQTSSGRGKPDLPYLQPWGAPPTLHGFQGGNLSGVLQHMDYILELGANAIYLNPIFLSPSNHRYNTSDYFQIDHRLGNLADFRALLDAAHTNGLRVILDGVFNHCSRSFFAFADLLENEDESIYRDWFHVRQFPLNAYTRGKAHNYAGWWGYKSLPKFNTDTPAVQQYILDIARYWIEQGADGWRLDVPNEIDDDDFWAAFRQVVKTANPQAGLIGEIWTVEPRWVDDAHFDGLMNYPLRAAILGLLMPPHTAHSGPQIPSLNIRQFAEQLERLLSLYPRENVYSMYTLLGSHDTERLRTLLGGGDGQEAQADPDSVQARLKLAYAILFAYPGAPAIYYGDEIGLVGGHDPACRGAFPWEADTWNHDLRAWIQTIIALRKRLVALRRGDFQRLLLDEKHNLYAFARSSGAESVVVALNASSKPHKLTIPLGNLAWNPALEVHDLLNAHHHHIIDQHLTLNLPAWGIAWCIQADHTRS